ncbi:casein kinase I isoform delta [Suillus subaureus]|uniref:Casein kinase I isoform delta n=1 Tax=Suillus subaureus TaxID=48587 RepID=A0A9P7E6Q8_9AGAM|nr:casein kinase I isoform delta [Suillus subaureus]KAG1812255.1 casein kinase I isoform delta [Suillus subaureus]
MNKVPVRVDGRFRLGDVIGSGSYAIVYSAWNIINDDHVALKLETIVNHPSSVEHEYCILKKLEGRIGIPHTLWFGRESVYHALVLELLGPSLHQLFLANGRKFSLLHVMNIGDQLLSCLEYIHLHNYVHGNIKLQNILMGLWNLRHTAFIIDFGITKSYWNAKTSDHVPFHHGQSLSGTPAFASINNHLGVEPGHRDDLESLTYMLIYFLHGSLPWLTSDNEKLSGSTILECKACATIADICQDIPVEFVTILIYTHSLAFAEDPNYDHLHSLLHECKTVSKDRYRLYVVVGPFWSPGGAQGAPGKLLPWVLLDMCHVTHCNAHATGTVW